MIRTQSTPTILIGLLLVRFFSANAQTNTGAQQPGTAPQPPLTAQAKPGKVVKPISDGISPAMSLASINNKKEFQPRCSTEKVNDSCYVNINRLYPYSYPGFTMKPGASITVNVFHPLSFEKLTLEPAAPANVYQGTDQFGSLVTAITPGLKGTSFDNVKFNDEFASILSVNLLGITNLPPPPNQAATDLEQEIKNLETTSNALLDNAKSTYIDPAIRYQKQTNEIYRQVRLISLAVPRPVGDPNQVAIDQTVFDNIACFQSPEPTDPWQGYVSWRKCMLRDLLTQGNQGTTLWSLFPNKCQNVAGPSSPWTVPTPACNATGDTVAPLQGPHIDSAFDTAFGKISDDLKTLSLIPSEQPTYEKLKDTADKIKLRHDEIAGFLSGILGAVPPTLTKISTDMQNFYIALLNAPPPEQHVASITVGYLYGPSALDTTDKKVVKYLGVPLGLAPTITYNVNGQNQITNTLLSAPATTQRTLIAAIPLTFANPRFETSTGVFLSTLNNRTFANFTDVSISTSGTTQTPTPMDVKISETTTNKPLIIPYYAAHYRISPEWLWPGGRRGAFYLTGALGINPYLTDLEYAAGFGISWRYLMFSPVYHLGRSTHLTQGEMVGQTLCVYSTSASSSTTPPTCAGSPAAPTTKNFLTGAFAFGIGIRIPTTFASTNK